MVLVLRRPARPAELQRQGGGRAREKTRELLNRYGNPKGAFRARRGLVFVIAGPNCGQRREEMKIHGYQCQ
jgi:hypothetical protein